MANKATSAGRAPSAQRGRFKFDPRDGFVQVPNSVIDLLGDTLNPYAFAVLSYAARQSWRGGSDFSVAKCQSDLRLSKRRWLYTVLPCLRALGALTVERLPAVNGLSPWRHVFEWPTLETIERARSEGVEPEPYQGEEGDDGEDGERPQAVDPVDNSAPASVSPDGPETGPSEKGPSPWSQIGTPMVTERDHVVLSQTTYVKRGVPPLDPECERLARLLRGERVNVPSTWVTAERLAALVAAGLCSEAQADHLGRQFR